MKHLAEMRETCLLRVIVACLVVCAMIWVIASVFRPDASDNAYQTKPENEKQSINPSFVIE